MLDYHGQRAKQLLLFLQEERHLLFLLEEVLLRGLALLRGLQGEIELCLTIVIDAEEVSR